MNRNLVRFTLTVFLAASLLMLFSGGKMKEGKVKGVKEVALISVFCDKRIDTSDFKGIGAATNRLRDTADLAWIRPGRSRIADRFKGCVWRVRVHVYPIRKIDEKCQRNCLRRFR